MFKNITVSDIQFGGRNAYTNKVGVFSGPTPGYAFTYDMAHLSQ